MSKTTFHLSPRLTLYVFHEEEHVRAAFYFKPLNKFVNFPKKFPPETSDDAVLADKEFKDFYKEKFGS